MTKLVNGKLPTHLFCGKYLCVKAFGRHGVSYEFDDSESEEDIISLRDTYTGKQFYEFPVPKPKTLYGYSMYQGKL